MLTLDLVVVSTMSVYKAALNKDIGEEILKSPHLYPY